jgi:adenylate cyclase
MSGDAKETGETHPPTSAPEAAQTPASAAVPQLHQRSGHGHGHHPVQFRFLDELKRRNVGRVAILYLVVCWLILEPVHVIFHMLEVPVWANRLVIILMALGFPAVTIFAWVYELTPDGLKPAAEVDRYTSIRAQTGKRLNRATIAVLALALAYFVVDKFWLSKHAAAEEAPAQAETAIAPKPAAISERSIAVLPFTDMSEKKDQEYFADGMAAEVLDLLAKIPGLKIIGRTSSFQFKATPDDLRTIGVKLGAAYIVEGSVRKTGDHIRVAAQLIDAHNGAQRWSSTYDRKSSDVFEVQDAIALSLARALQLTVRSDFGSRAAAHSADGYDVYLRGLRALDQYSQESADQAAGDFQQALSLDPTFAPAALGLAKVYRLKGENGWLLPTRAAFERARQAADLALKLDPKLGAAHAVLADIHVIYDWDWNGADLEIKQALNLGAQGEAIQAAVRLAAVRGQWNQATELFETGLAADPLNPDLLLLAGWGVDLRSGRFAEADSLFRRVLEISPAAGSANWFLGLSLVFQNRFDEALAVMQRETLYDGQLEGTAIVYHALGKKAQSNSALKQAIEQNAEEWPSAIARVYAYRGDRDQAMNWLERAYSAKDEDLHFIKGDPLMRNLEGDPRYEAFLRKMKFPE